MNLMLDLLLKIKFIIIENDIIDRYAGGSNFSSNTAALFDCGYRLFNIGQPSTPSMQAAYDTIYFKVDDECFSNEAVKF